MLSEPIADTALFRTIPGPSATDLDLPQYISSQLYLPFVKGPKRLHQALFFRAAAKMHYHWRGKPPLFSFLDMMLLLNAPQKRDPEMCLLYRHYYTIFARTTVSQDEPVLGKLSFRSLPTLLGCNTFKSCSLALT